MLAYAFFIRSFTPALPVGVIHVMPPVLKVKVMLAFSEVICHATLMERIAYTVWMVFDKPLLPIEFPHWRGMTSRKKFTPRSRTVI